MNRKNNRWLILSASCVINLCAGSLYAWSVFAEPMTQYLNTNLEAAIAPGGLAIVFTVANMVGPVTMISGGAINDRIGPRWMVFIGGLLFGGGMFFSGFATSVGFLIISYSMGCGLGMGLIYGCNISNCVKFFPDKKGLAGGLATASYGISSVIIPPIANHLNETAGVTGSFKILGLAFLIIICAMAFVLKKPPESHEKEDTEELNYTWKKMIKSKTFYIMLFMMTCGAISGLMCISQASPVAVQVVGMSTVSAALAVSLLALFNTAGRIVAGYISDSIGRINTLALSFVFTAAGLVLLFITREGDKGIFYLGTALIGIAFGAIMGIFPALTAEEFGMKNNSVNYGIMFIGFAIAGYLGPTVMKTMYDIFGGYDVAFAAAFMFTAAGGMLLVVYKIVRKPKPFNSRSFMKHH